MCYTFYRLESSKIRLKLALFKDFGLYRMLLQSTVGVMPLQGYWWAGQGNATLTEPASSKENCPKTRRLPPPWLRCSSGDRVHAVLGVLYWQHVGCH